MYPHFDLQDLPNEIPGEDLKVVPNQIPYLPEMAHWEYQRIDYYEFQTLHMVQYFPSAVFEGKKKLHYTKKPH